MINKNVTLILGAGASQPYGFPSGLKLMKEIAQEKVPQLFSQLLEYWQYKGEDLLNFRRELTRFGGTSIDAFLQAHLFGNSGFVRLGKLLIAVKMSMYEIENQIYSIALAEDRDPQVNGRTTPWYSYFFEHLMENEYFTDRNNKTINVITYNYDRSFEFFLSNAIRGHYPAENEKSWLEKLNFIPIVHLHGMLGELQNFSVTRGRPFKPLIHTDALGNTFHADLPTLANEIQDVASTIKVVGDDFNNDPNYNKAHEMVGVADSVVFLGFGYGRENLNRLNIPVFAKPPHVGRLFGTTYKMTIGEQIDWVFGPLRLPITEDITFFQDEDALTFLRKERHRIFRN